MPSTKSGAFAEFLARFGERMSSPTLELTSIRDSMESIHLATAEPEGITYAETSAGGVDALWCIPTNADPERVLLHNEMGIMGVTSMHASRKAAAHIAKAAGMRSLVVNLRRTLEYKYPAQTEDVEAAYIWLMSEGYQPEHIASIGHSIGGNLAISLAVRLRDSGAPMPGAIVSISPWCDMTMSDKTIDENARRDTLLSRPFLERCRSAWLEGTEVSLTDPRVNLLEADLSGLPPLAVFYGEYELLAGEAFRLAMGALAVGNDVHLRPIQAGQHSFIIGAGRVPEADDAITEMGLWLRKVLLAPRSANERTVGSGRPVL